MWLNAQKMPKKVNNLLFSHVPSLSPARSPVPRGNPFLMAPFP